jgi:hypothetical protein
MNTKKSKSKPFVLESPLQSERALWFALMGFTLTFSLQFPGVYSPDSVLILQQASNLAPNSNWHSPVLRELWQIITLGGVHPVWLFVTQVLVFSYIIYISTKGIKRFSHALIMFFVLLNPVTLNIVSFVSKDSAILLIVLLIYSLYFHQRNVWNKRQIIFITLCMIFASSLRVNVVILFIPLIVDFFRNHLRNETQCRKLNVTRGSSASVFMIIALSLSLNTLLSGRDLSPQNVVPLWDVTGISVRTGRILIPNDFQASPKCSLEELGSQYSTRIMDPLLWGENACLSTMLPEDYIEQSKKYQKTGEFSSAFPLSQWLKIVVSNPIPYLEHRIAVGANLLGITNPPTGTLLKSSAPSAISVNVDPNFNNYLHNTVYKALEEQKWMGIFFLPIIWLLALVIFLMKVSSHRRKIVLISTFAFTFGTILISPGTDLRYLYPVFAFLVVSVSDYFANVSSSKHS